MYSEFYLLFNTLIIIFFYRSQEDDPDAYEIIPNSEFVVSRTAHKDNSSYYQLNGIRVQYKEIASLLRKYGVDLDHNRFLILQVRFNLTCFVYFNVLL